MIASLLIVAGWTLVVFGTGLLMGRRSRIRRAPRLELPKSRGWR